MHTQTSRRAHHMANKHTLTETHSVNTVHMQTCAVLIAF